MARLIHYIAKSGGNACGLFARVSATNQKQDVTCKKCIEWIKEIEQLGKSNVSLNPTPSSIKSYPNSKATITLDGGEKLEGVFKEFEFNVPDVNDKEIRQEGINRPITLYHNATLKGTVNISNESFWNFFKAKQEKKEVKQDAERFPNLSILKWLLGKDIEVSYSHSPEKSYRTTVIGILPISKNSNSKTHNQLIVENPDKEYWGDTHTRISLDDIVKVFDDKSEEVFTLGKIRNVTDE